MIDEKGGTLNANSILETLTKTLLYEGYALYPYHRSSVKNQKPIPFGVVFPQQYALHNQHVHSTMQIQCIVTGNSNPLINITIRFLHLKRIALFQRTNGQDATEENFAAVQNAGIDHKFYQAGWQTIERTVSSGDLLIAGLLKKKKIIAVEFEKTEETENSYDENNQLAARRISSVSGIKGTATIQAAPVKNRQNVFQIGVNITNTTPVENAETVTRDDVLSHSFLSTHTILHTCGGEFISHQNPEENWTAVIDGCINKNAWPILIDQSNTTMLASPIILYDYPQINPASSGDLFDSTEIEEALLLHVSVLSDDEKKRIAQDDEKLKAMLNKVSNVSPEELINFHSSLKYIATSPDNYKIP